MDKISYALGLNIGANLKQAGINGLIFEEFAKGIKAILDGAQPEISIDEAQALLNQYFTELQEETTMKAKSEGESFLAENAKNATVVTLPSGLQYEIMTAGTGEKPAASDSVKCHYHGTLLDGTVFDSSVMRGQPATFGVSQVIQGWVEALQLMPVGSKWKLFIPSDLAYGAQGAGQHIAPHSALVFEVELLEIV